MGIQEIDKKETRQQTRQGMTRQDTRQDMTQDKTQDKKEDQTRQMAAKRRGNREHMNKTRHDMEETKTPTRQRHQRGREGLCLAGEVLRREGEGREKSLATISLV